MSIRTEQEGPFPRDARGGLTNPPLQGFGFVNPNRAGGAVSPRCSRGIDKSPAAGSDLSIRTEQGRGRFPDMLAGD
ncbi:hypothetical protein QUF80_09495 [Desulfococcaceae bacterium HSG8]|nr:hypothetical protein [Desulfococcaceae bacterium HSG8]